jgi:uncharacterized GH25 family protein
MFRNTISSKKLVFLVSTTILFVIPVLKAHELWLLASEYNTGWPDNGSRTIKPSISLSWGHSMPFDTAPSAGMVNSVTHYMPNGFEEEFLIADTSIAKAYFKIVTPGAHIFASGIIPQWRSVVLNPDGTRSHLSIAKDKVNPALEVISAYYRVSYAKALLVVGENGSLDEELQRAIGHEIEIVPLVNPAKLSPGDDFPIKILFNGQPIPSDTTQVSARHEKHKDLPAGQGLWDGLVNSNGMAVVPIDRNGIWKISVSRRFAAPERVAHKVDELRFQATLTFKIP